MLSYWEKQSFTNYNHIVAGGGLTGISVAIELKETFPRARVLVLERGLLPTGATTRNAGFACMGSAGELLADLEAHTEESVVSLFMRRKAGLDILRHRLGDAALGYKADGGYELLSAGDRTVVDQLGYLNDLLRKHLGKNAFRQADHLIDEFGFSRRHIGHLIENTTEGSIHSGETMRHLIEFARLKGVEIMTGAEVKRFDDHRDEVAVTVSEPFRRESILFCCDTFTICTNGFARQLLPNEAVEPGRGQVMITKPVAGLGLKGMFHYDAGYYYFRELDGRVLIGGGRNMDFTTENTTDFSLNRTIQLDLEEKLRDMILPRHTFEIDMRWAGIMAFGPVKAPIVKAFSERVYGAFRMGGMGVALGSLVAKEVVRLIANPV